MTSDRAVWPFISTLVLSVVLAVFATMGGRQIFVKEMLGGAYDSQAEHFLRGNVDVDGEEIRYEAIVVHRNARMYFGPFPALLRIPLNYIYPAGRGRWSRFSGLCAGVIALSSFAGLVAHALKSSRLSSGARAWLGTACITGFALGSPILFLLGNLSIYNEAIIWGLACSLAAFFFANRVQDTSGRQLVALLFGFSFFAAAALLSRATFGLPFLLITPLLFLRLPNKRSGFALAALFLPLGAGLIAYLLLSYARFETWSGFAFTGYINPTYREFAKHHGTFSLTRIPFGFVDYFRLPFPHIQSTAPFLLGERHAVPCPSLYPLPFSENYVSLIWCSGWLVAGAVIGVIHLFRCHQSDLFKRWAASAFLVQFGLVLSYFALAQRYSADLYPLLIVCLLAFLNSSGSWLARWRYVFVALVVISAGINTSTTISWLANRDQNVLPETRNIWNSILNKPVLTK